MAVERMIMMNVVGKNSYVDEVAKDILFMENVQVIDAFHEIDTFRFTIDVTEQNMDEILGFSELESGNKNANCEDFIKRMDLLKEVFGEDFKIYKPSMNWEMGINEAIKTVNTVYSKIHHKYKVSKILYEDIREIKKSIGAYKYFLESNINMEELNSLEYFNYVVGTLSKESVARLKRNYGNITAIVVHVGSSEDNEVYVIISPKDLEVETHRILNSLNFNKIEGLKSDYKGSAKEIITWLENKLKLFQDKVHLLEDEIGKLKNMYRKDAILAYSALYMYNKINGIKKEMAFSKDNFYFSGWIPQSMKEKIKNVLSKYKDILIIFNDNPDENVKPPTKLKNNWLFRPFEMFIKMYGIPDHNELDPTPFLSITYMLLFGFMFGDIGQGFVLFSIGSLLLLKGVQIGGIIQRLGCVSIFFGALYGSLFGFEHLLPAIWIKPFENINTMLSIAIIMGVCLLLMAYLYGIINLFKSKSFYDGALSKHGITGFILYTSLLLFALPYITSREVISVEILLISVITMIMLIFLKEPIQKKISKQDSIVIGSQYYIESGFDLLETLLSMLSNTVSFIRIGAFALTHVGLFVAFETLAHMMNNGIGSVIILIIGNLLIISLEALIVGIQTLRLQYYELFSKYFKGGGIEFKPVKL